MSKGKVPSLLSASNGGITYDQSKRLSSCSRCKAVINLGDRIGFLKRLSTGFSNKRRLCLTCISEILDKTQKDLDLLKNTK